MKNDKETIDQSRIRSAFADFPCSGNTNPRLAYGPMTFAQIATNLELLSDSIKQYLEKLEQRERECDAMEQELRVVGSLVTRIQKLTTGYTFK